MSTGAVERMRSQQLLGLHGKEVAIEHGGRLDEGLGDRVRRQLEREAAGLEHAALDVLDPLLEVGVAGVDVGPGVEDADHRAAGPVLGGIAHLHQARAVAEGAQVVGREPAGAAQAGGGAAAGRRGGSCRGSRSWSE
jgi:hypothetical protein